MTILSQEPMPDEPLPSADALSGPWTPPGMPCPRLMAEAADWEAEASARLGKAGEEPAK